MMIIIIIIIYIHVYIHVVCNEFNNSKVKVNVVFLQMFIQIHNPKITGEIISLERHLYEVVQKEWDNQEPTGHSFAQQTQKDVSNTPSTSSFSK